MCNTAKQSGTTTNNTTQTAEMSPEERQWWNNRNAVDSASINDTISMNKNAANDVNTLLTGGNLPGNLGMLSQGISQDRMNAQAMQAGRMTNATLNQVGLSDAGVGKVAMARSMSDSLNSNTQFNIQTLQQLLNQAIGGQASVVGTTQNNAGQMGSILPGLRSISGTSSGTSSQSYTPGMMTTIGQGMSGIGGMAMGLGTGGTSSMWSSLMKSSIKVKDNIKDSDIDSINIIKNTHIVTYDYKPEIEISGKRIGVIAEEVNPIMTNKEKSGWDIPNTVGLLLDAVKKLTNKVEVLENRSN